MTFYTGRRALRRPGLVPLLLSFLNLLLVPHAAEARIVRVEILRTRAAIALRNERFLLEEDVERIIEDARTKIQFFVNSWLRG